MSLLAGGRGANRELEDWCSAEAVLHDGERLWLGTMSYHEVFMHFLGSINAMTVCAMSQRGGSFLAVAGYRTRSVARRVH